MFSIKSRYRRSALTTIDRRTGIPIHAVELRIPPRTEGSFQHRVEEGDRIDSLAHKYYRDPLQWWRIADANPEFPTPAALLGTSPWQTERFGLTPPPDPAPWATTLMALARLSGVSSVIREPRFALTTESIAVGGDTVEVVRERVDESVLVTYNAVAVSPAALIAVLTAAGFEVRDRETASRVGQVITIPPERPA